MESDVSTKFSPSKLATYKDCPRRYRYRYVDKIKSETQSVEAFVGDCVHKALEALYQGVLHGKTLPLEEVVKAYLERWEQRWTEAVVIRSRKYSARDYQKVGRDCVEGYYRAHEPFTSDKTVGIEKRVGLPIEVGGEVYRIEGFIDRLALAPDGAFEIHDYKTSASLPAQEDVDCDPQLAIYELAVRADWPDATEVRLVWHYVRFGKTLISRRDPQSREALKNDIVSTIEAIKSDHRFEPRRSALCDWCEYKDICPLWSHPERVAALAPEERRQDDGVRLVDLYAALEAKKKSLREELRSIEKEEEGLESRLIEFAQAAGVSVVAGGDGTVEVSEKEEMKLPTKTRAPEDLEALETELRKLPLWSGISRLDGGLFLEGYRKRAWPQTIMDAVGPLMARYVKCALVKTVRFRKRQEATEE